MHRHCVANDHRIFAVPSQQIAKKMKIELELTPELANDVEQASTLCSCDWSPEMATSAMNIVEAVRRAKTTCETRSQTNP